jgi:myo-inositol-1(or 4)-monophosphatase
MPKFAASTVVDQMEDLVLKISEEEIVHNFKIISHKRKHDGSPVTAVDTAVQVALQEALPKILDAPVLGEEMSEDEQVALWELRESGLWCVDPIDGTTNFVNGIPYFSISIAYFKGGEPVVGMVVNPMTQEIFSAELGAGAWLGAQRLSDKLPRHSELRDCVASADFKRLPEILKSRLVTYPPYASQRNFGSACLEWCHVASGLFDVYVHGNQKVWDFAAGALILSESGGVMETFQKGPFWDDGSLSRPIIAARDPAIFKAWAKYIREAL